MVGLQGSIDETLAEDAPFDATAFLVANNESEDPKANEIFNTYTQNIIGSSLLVIALVLVIIYGGYFFSRESVRRVSHISR